MTSLVSVRRATASDLPYLVALQRKWTEAVGFLPAAAIAGYLGTGPYAAHNPHHRGWIAEVNGDPVGYLLGSPGLVGASLKIVQVCLQGDARRQEYGSALVAAAEAHAQVTSRAAVSCAVATDLEARSFWDALGYDVRAVTDGGRSRGRRLERRYKVLSGGLFVPTSAREVTP